MKTLLLPLAATALCCSLASADQTLTYPAENPLVSFTAPDDWKAEPKGNSLFVVSPDGGDVIVEIMTMEAAMDDDAAAVTEAKGIVDKDFKDLKLTKTDPVEANGLTVSLLGGDGEDASGPAHINMALAKHPNATHPILLCVIASKENASKHGAAVGALFNSLAAIAPAPAAAESPASSGLQTFSYPDKEKPDFTIDFPADWVMKATDEGAYVESPDKLVAMNVIIVDKADTVDAEETLKKNVGERFKEIVWNGGKEPEVNKDDALGLTATFQNAVASDGGDTEKYSVNLLSYVRKDGDKTFILLSQNPLRALDTHAEAMEAVVKSIKVR